MLRASSFAPALATLIFLTAPLVAAPLPAREGPEGQDAAEQTPTDQGSAGNEDGEPQEPNGGKDLPDPDAEGLRITERLEILIERIKLQQAELETMEAEFVQIKESEMLVETQESRGYFWYQAPDQVRWDFADPDDMVVLIREGSMLTWFQDLKRAERVNVGRQADRVMEYLSASNSLRTLQRYFNLQVAFPKDSEAPYDLKLSPRVDRVAERIAGMQIKLHRTGFYPVYLRYEEPGGDVTELRFEKVVVNEPIEEGRFEIELPDDVDVQTLEFGSKRKKGP